MMPIVLQFSCIENESYTGLAHNFCITTIDMFTIDDKGCGYLQKEQCNIILLGFITINHPPALI